MRRAAWVAGVLVLAALLAIPLGRAVRSLAMTRGGMATFNALVASANAGDLDSARSLCSKRYLKARPLRTSPEGGVVGLPRSIHPNFRAWTEGNDVWICPTDRIGPVYRLVREGDKWRFDGVVGLLRPSGRLEVSGEGGEIEGDNQ